MLQTPWRWLRSRCGALVVLGVVISLLAYVVVSRVVATPAPAAAPVEGSRQVDVPAHYAKSLLDTLKEPRLSRGFGLRDRSTRKHTLPPGRHQ